MINKNIVFVLYGNLDIFLNTILEKLQIEIIIIIL